MVGQRKDESGWLRRTGKRTRPLLILVSLVAVPSCQDFHYPNGAALIKLDFGSSVQEGEVTLNDGDDTQVSFKKAFQSPPRLTIVELRQSKFDKKPFAISDFQIVQVESTYFKIQNTHSEQRLGSWATVKWRAEGILAEKKRPKTVTGSASLGQNGKPTQDQIIDRIKELGGKVTVYPLSAGTIIGVDLHRTKATDADLQMLQGLTQLRTLNLYGAPITDAGLRYVSGITSLQTLYLNETAVTNAGLASLQGLTHLSELGLHDTRVTDEGLFYLRSLTNLQSLSLSGAQITDQGLMQLKPFHDLKKLVLSRTSVTTAGIQELKRALPKVQIIR
jgi:hypothetical protein